MNTTSIQTTLLSYANELNSHVASKTANLTQNAAEAYANSPIFDYVEPSKQRIICSLNNQSTVLKEQVNKWLEEIMAGIERLWNESGIVENTTYQWLVTEVFAVIRDFVYSLKDDSLNQFGEGTAAFYVQWFLLVVSACVEKVKSQWNESVLPHIEESFKFAQSEITSKREIVYEKTEQVRRQTWEQIAPYQSQAVEQIAPYQEFVSQKAVELSEKAVQMNDLYVKDTVIGQFVEKGVSTFNEYRTKSFKNRDSDEHSDTTTDGTPVQEADAVVTVE